MMVSDSDTILLRLSDCGLLLDKHNALTVTHTPE